MRSLGLMLVALLGLAGHAFGTDKVWVGGTSSNWFDAPNWDPAGVPSSTDSVALTNLTTVVVTGDVAIASLELRRASLVVSNQITVTNLLLASGRLSAWVVRPNPFTNPPPDSAIIEIPTSGTLRIEPDPSGISTLGFTLDGARLNLRGTGSCTNRATVLLFYRSEFNVHGTLTLRDEVSFDGANGPPAGSLNVYGLLQRPAGTNVSFFSVNLTNRGTIWLQSGTMNIASGVNSGLMNLSGGTTQSFIGTPFRWEGGNIIGGGTVRLTRGTFDVGTNKLVIPHLHGVGGGLLVSNEVRVPEGNWDAGMLRGPGQLIAGTNGHFSMKQGNIIDTRVINVSKFYFESNALVSFGGAASLINYGAIELGNGANLFANDPPFVPPPWSIVNYGGLYSNPDTTNNMTLRLTNAGNIYVRGNLQLLDAIQTSGKTEIESTLRVPNGYSINAGLLNGTGTIQGIVRSAGITTPGFGVGQLTVNGSFTNRGAINIELGSSSDPLMSDLLSVSNHMRLGGSLVVCYNGTTWPAPGTTWEVLRFGSSAGSFNSIEGLDLGGGRVLQPVFSPTNLTLVLSNQPVQRNLFTTTRCLPGQLELRFTGDAGQTYSIDVSTNLTSWTSVLITNSPDGVIYFRDSLTASQRFYRARANP